MFTLDPDAHMTSTLCNEQLSPRTPQLIATRLALFVFGLGITIVYNHALYSLFGFILVGLGAYKGVPILFSAGDNQPALPANLAFATVTSVGYAGILASPALIGFITQFFTPASTYCCWQSAPAPKPSPTD